MDCSTATSMLRVYQFRHLGLKFCIHYERETGLEPATFSLARRRSSQLSYSRFFIVNVRDFSQDCHYITS
jgi:hypothetical protein